MAVFAYKACQRGVGELTGTIVADSPRHARDLLRERDMVIHDVTPLRSTQTWRWRSMRWGTSHRVQVVAFIRELATLLAVGIPILQALDTLAKQHKGRFHHVLLRLRDRVAAGVGLADAMRDQPHVFDELAVNMVEVGERSGTLEEVLERLADFRERAQQLRGRIGGALIYPCIVLAMAIVITLLLMTFVVPNILQPLLQTGRELPAITLIVKSASDFLIAYWWVPAVMLLAAVVGVAILLRTDRVRVAWHRGQLRIPILGQIIRKQAIVRIALIMSTLMRSGIVFLSAAAIAQRSTANRVMREALASCEQAVHAGRDIAQALEATGAFPPTVVQVFSVGQQSGRLEEMLERLALDYDRQVQSAAQRFTSLLEPIMILVLAVMVGVIAFATILPILEAGHVL